MKYYYVVYQSVDKYGKIATGWSTLSFSGGDFMPKTAIKGMLEKAPNLKTIVILNWKEISAESFEEFAE